MAQLKALNTKVDKGAVHYFSVNSSKPANPDGTNWDNDGATGKAAVAIGIGAQAKGYYSTALGNDAKALEYASTALGDEAQAQGDSSTALGSGAQATVEGSVALGESAVAGREAGKVGYLASAGDTTFDAVLTALGKKTDYNNWTETISKLKEDERHEYDGLKLMYAEADKSGKSAAKTALDEWERNHQDFVNALKEKSKLEVTWRATKAAVSVGVDGEVVDKQGNKIIETRQITNVAAGSADTDAVNVAQLKALEKGLVHYFSVNSTKQGAGSNWNNDGATGEDAIAIGKKAVSEGVGSIAIGRGSKVFNTNTSLGMAIGDGAESSFGSIVIGKFAKDYDTDPKKGSFGVYILSLIHISEPTRPY